MISICRHDGEFELAVGDFQVLTREWRTDSKPDIASDHGRTCASTKKAKHCSARDGLTAVAQVTRNGHGPTDRSDHNRAHAIVSVTYASQ